MSVYAVIEPGKYIDVRKETFETNIMLKTESIVTRSKHIKPK